MKYQLLRPLNKEEYEALKNNIAENGVITPVVYDEDGNILDGHHRVKACKELGIDDWPSIIRTGLTEAEKKAQVLVLNEARRHLTEADKKELREARIEIERELRKQGYSYRRIADAVGIDEKQVRRDLSGADMSAPKTITGADGKEYPAERESSEQPNTYEKKSIFLHSQKNKDKAKKVWEAAKSGEKKAEKEVEKLDKGQTTIHSAHKKIKQKEEVVEPPELPDGEYDVILADPPWRYQFSETNMRSIENQYATMSLQDIKNMDIPASDDAVLYLWATAPKLEEAMQVINEWGFDYKTCAVWDKEKMGMGYWWRVQHELLLVGVRGDFSPPEAENRVRSVFREERGEHSTKPEKVYDIIESMFPGHRFLELFARSEREDWEVWGDEAGE